MFEPSSDCARICAVLVVWPLLVWACPALVGLWTQIRRGLPDFARAPRTIIAAANYESHRLIYLAPLVGIGAVADLVHRATMNAMGTPANIVLRIIAIEGLLLAIVLFAGAGWIGPVRSDYTRQLVRSRFHAARIVVMYAVMFPLVFAWGLDAAIPMLGDVLFG